MASELVKFLTLNTGFVIVEMLVKSNTTLKADVIELKKIIAGSTKIIATLADKVDLYESTVDKLKQRFAKSEENDTSDRLRMPATSLHSHLIQVMT